MDFSTYIQDLIRGTKILKTSRFLEQTDFWTKDKLYEYRLQKLQDLIMFSYEHVPYYRELMDSVQIKPEEIRTLEDVKKIPVSTKEMIRKAPQKLIVENINLDSRKIKTRKNRRPHGNAISIV